MSDISTKHLYCFVLPKLHSDLHIINTSVAHQLLTCKLVNVVLSQENLKYGPYPDETSQVIPMFHVTLANQLWWDSRIKSIQLFLFFTNFFLRLVYPLGDQNLEEIDQGRHEMPASSHRYFMYNCHLSYMQEQHLFCDVYVTVVGDSTVPSAKWKEPDPSSTNKREKLDSSTSKIKALFPA